jgi:HTH-type transcriptional regulator/antitoxin HigA
MATTKSQNTRRNRDSYMELIRRFPLKPIKNDAEHGQATGIISELMGGRLDGGAGDYLDTLIVLVNKYEDEHHAIDERMTPQAALRALMEANGLNQAAVGRIIGSESAVSMFLKGDRSLSKVHIRKLGERFKIDPMVFMD